MTDSKRQLRVFLCHASADKPIARDLYRRLVNDGVDVWMDETSLLPGMDWKLEIPRAVSSADAIIICLSKQSVAKEGYVQKEIRFALDAAQEKPDGTIYILPVRLDACDIPSSIARWQWVDLFSSDGYRKLRISLRLRAESIGAVIYPANRKPEQETHPARNYTEPQNDTFKFPGKFFAILIAVILTFAGIVWIGGRMFSADGQTPSPTPTLASTLTLETASTLTETPFPINSPTPFQPVIMPTAALALPSATNTFIILPTQIEFPTVTVPPSSTPFPAPPMVLIPAGSFLMGKDGGSKDEAPAHTIFLDAFYIDQYEVTNERYHFCALSGACKSAYIDTTSVPEKYYGEKYSEHPVVNVTWDMAAAYCQWRGARLPTEAEWEKAARGGLEKMFYPWGNTTPICDAGSRNGALFLDCTNDKMTVNAGSYFANGYGLFDMAGNVWEWVFDAYSSSYYGEIPANAANPQGPVFVDLRVVRGGGWNDPIDAIQVSNRGWAPPETRDNEIGFRCAMTAR